MIDTKSTNTISTNINIPEYPNFRKFNINDKHWYIKFYARFEPYADFAFGNLLIWLDYKNDLMISEINNNIVFKFTNILTVGEQIYTILGKEKMDLSLNTLFNDGVKELSFVPEVVIDSLKNKLSYNISLERESFDYILNVPRMSYLLGPEIRKLRREVRLSIKDYGEHITLKEPSMHNDTTVEFLINNLHTWEKAFTLTKNDSEKQELYALNKSLVLAKHIDNRCFCTYVDGKLEGFIIYQTPPQKEYVILNHIKTSYAYRYIFDFMMFAFASRVQQSNYKFINFEQDLGIEGLRNHKLALKPIRFLKKYSIKTV